MILGYLTAGDGKGYQIAECIHHGTHLGGNTSTASSDCLMCAGTMPGPCTMLVGVNVTSINDKFHVSLQSRKFKNGLQIPSFLPSSETGIDGFPRPIFIGQGSPWCAGSKQPMYGIEKVSDIASRSSTTRRTFCWQ